MEHGRARCGHAARSAISRAGSNRARGNFLETFPLAIVALLGVVVAGKANGLSAIAAWVWLAARLVYLPLYWAGVPKVRTLVWAIALLALLVVLGVLLLG